MNSLNVYKLTKILSKPLLSILFFLVFISTCTNPTTPGNNNNNNNILDSDNTEGFSIYHEISYAQEVINDVVIKTDTITAYITQEGDPAIEKYVVFNRLYDTQGTLTPSSVLSDSMGIAQSIYGLVYSEYNNQISSDTVRNIIIDIGAGNDASSIFVHDTVIITYEQKAIEPLSATEYFNFYPNNSSVGNFSEEIEISVIARDNSGVGVCNLPVRFQLIKEKDYPGDNDPVPHGAINKSLVKTCETSSSEEESENSNTYGLASVKYTNNRGGVDTLIAKIIDPANDTLYLYADTIRIETWGGVLLIEDVESISSNAGSSNMIISNVDSIKTDTIFARALDANGAMISGIPFEYSLSEDYNGATYLTAGGAISDSAGLAYSILKIHPSIFSTQNNTDDLESMVLSVSVDIPSTDKSSNVNVSVINDLPAWFENSASLTLLSETYILPCESCASETSTIITATLLDSLNNPPPSGTIIEFSSLQKDTTGSSGDGYENQWLPIGNIAPGATFNSNGEATVDFHIQNDRGIAHIIGTVENYNISDTIQVIIESTIASHINILSPNQDEIMVQGGGGVEYSEVFVQITDNTGNIVYDKPYKVQFNLTGSPSGTTLENSTTPITKIAESGQTSVTIVSGTAPGSVHLTVSLFNENDNVSSATPIASAESIPLTIVTGPPQYGELNFSVVDMIPVPGGGIYEYPLSVYLEDVHSNPVSDSTSVYFKIREKTDTYDKTANYNFNDKVTWLSPDSTSTTVLDSIVYTCIDQINNCLAGVEPDSDVWEPSSHPAEIVGEGEIGMYNPLDGTSYPGVAFTKMIFGSNSIASEVIVFAQAYSADNSLFIVDSRTNHSGNGIVFPCYECAITLSALPTQWDFSQFPFNVNAETDFQDVMVSATVTDYFQFPVFNAEILLDAPQADFIYVCGGEDSDLDGTTGDCTLVADGTTTLPLVRDCWTCVENYAPDYAWVVENSDNNDIADTDGALVIIPDDIPNYARTSSSGVGEWTLRYSEGVNIPQGNDPVTYQTFNTTISVFLVTPSTNNPSENITIIISKSEED